VLKEALDLAPGDVIILLVDTESKLMELNSMDLGGQARFNRRQVHASVRSLRTVVRHSSRGGGEPREGSRGFGCVWKHFNLAKDATAIRYANNTPPSITKYLRLLAIDLVDTPLQLIPEQQAFGRDTPTRVLGS
jgi:hypothetical protein